MEVGSIGKKSHHLKRTLEDDDTFTVKLDQFGMREQNSMALQIAVMEMPDVEW